METESNLPRTQIPNHLSDAKRRVLQERLRGRRAAFSEEEEIQPRPAEARVPISAEQQRIWFNASTYPDLPIYNEPITIHKRGTFNLEIFEAAFQTFLERHEAWRTSFVLGEQDEIVQVVHPSFTISLPFTDLSGLPAEERESEAFRIATRDAETPIALDHPPLFRARVLRFAPDEHRLYLVLHHIIFDGVTIYRVLMRELTAIYEALEAGKPVALPRPTLQYADYSLWRQRHLASPAIAQQLEYWKQQLSGDLPVLRLASDRPRPSQITYRGSMECFSISPDLIAQLRSVARSHKVTLYMVLLAAFKVLLFRYNGQEDLIIGGVTDARRRPELEGVVGYFLDTFAVRTQPSRERRFSDYLQEVRGSVLGALDAADVPFHEVVHAVQPKRDSSHHPIFQAFFSIEPPVDPFSEGWDLTQMDVANGTAKFDLYLELDERPDHMAARFLYNTDIFDAETIRRMAAHWLVLLSGVVQTPETPLGALPLLTAAELSELDGPGSWNDTARAVPPTTLHQLIELQAQRSPERIAAVFEETAWTYADLMMRADLLRSALQSVGVGPGSLVALLIPRSLDMLAGLVAILAAGGAYFPLDPETEPVRTARSLEDAQCAAILTHSSLRSSLSGNIAPLLLVDEIGPSERVLSSPHAGTPDDLAYVMHTSGTTGRPKAVEILHSSLVNLLVSMQEKPGFTADDTMLAVTTISFDIAALELFLPLSTGGRVVIASRRVAQDSYLLVSTIQSSGCTVMQATPSTWRSLIGIGWRVSKELDRPLRILCGGEPLPRDLAERLLADGAELWNMYGPTETTVWSTVHRVTSGIASVPIGRPIANTTAHILDTRGQKVPVGVPGELYLGGSGVARGYRGAPGKTAERFVQREAVGEARLYSTGDLAVRRRDGTLECLGRTDNQVKVRGFRVELEAVEAAVLKHPKVQAAAARAWPDTGGGMRLSVYVVGRDGSPPDRPTLRRFLQKEIPEYMVPSDVIPIAVLPLTHNGKVDRSQLPPPIMSEAICLPGGLSSGYEQRLGAIWAELLNVSQIGVHDNFFDLGGHSLLVVRLQHRIALAFGQRLSMAALFHAPTIQLQAALLVADVEGAQGIPGILPLQVKGQRPKLFWMHPPVEILNLTEALGEEQPVLGVVLTQADMDAISATPEMENIANLHVQAILKAQPEGPFHLAGFCTGGIVAFEIATQLRSLGHKVNSLILLDAQNPSFYRRIDSLAVEFSKLRFYLGKAFKLSRSSKTLRYRLQSRARKIWKRELASTEMSVSEQFIDAAAYRYKPAVYAGDVALLRPRNRPSRVDHLPGWKATISGRLIDRTIEGHHEELFEVVKVRGLAQEIVSLLSSTKDRPL